MSNRPTTSQVHDIINKISSRSPLLKINGEHIFPRGPIRDCESTLKYDDNLESMSKTLILSQVPWETLQSRHKEFTGDTNSFHWPNHAPYRIIDGMDLGGRENVFIIYPYAFGINATDLNHTACIELVEFTEQISLRIIYPSIRLSFTNAREIVHELNRLPVANSIYMYAIMHEVGHYEGPYSLKLLNKSEPNPFIHMTGSELFADIYAFAMLQELSPVILLQTMMRFFWYLPKNTIHNDSDVIVSYYMINELVESKALTLDADKLHLDLNKMVSTFSQVPDLEKMNSFLKNLSFFENKLQLFVHAILNSTADLPKSIV